MGQASVLWKLLIPDPYLTYFLFFFKKIFFKKILIYVYVHVTIYAHTGQKKTSDPPGPQVTGSWNLPNVDGGTQTWFY